MAAQDITLDAHTLIWYIDKQSNKKLSKLALETIKTAEKTANIFVPIIALMEILHLIDAGRFPVPFGTIIKTLEENEAYHVVPFDMQLLKIAVSLQRMEIHDRLIMATAILTSSLLVSKDKSIHANNQDIVVIW